MGNKQGNAEKSCNIKYNRLENENNGQKKASRKNNTNSYDYFKNLNFSKKNTKNYYKSSDTDKTHLFKEK